MSSASTTPLVSPSFTQHSIQQPHHQHQQNVNVRVDLADLPNGLPTNGIQHQDSFDGMDSPIQHQYSFSQHSIVDEDDLGYQSYQESDDGHEDKMVKHGSDYQNHNRREDALQAKFMQMMKLQHHDSTSNVSDASADLPMSKTEKAEAAFNHFQQQFEELPYILVGSLAALLYGGIRQPEDLDIIVPNHDGLATVSNDLVSNDESKFDLESAHGSTVKMTHIATESSVDVGVGEMYFNVDEDGKVVGEDYNAVQPYCSKELLLASYLIRFDEDGKQDASQIEAIIGHKGMEKSDFADIKAKLQDKHHELAEQRWNSFFDK